MYASSGCWGEPSVGWLTLWLLLWGQHPTWNKEAETV